MPASVTATSIVIEHDDVLLVASETRFFNLLLRPLAIRPTEPRPVVQTHKSISNLRQSYDYCLRFFSSDRQSLPIIGLETEVQNRNKNNNRTLARKC